MARHAVPTLEVDGGCERERVMKERDVQRAILDYFAAKHVLAFRMQTGATVSEYRGKTRMVRFGTPGMADILAFPLVKCLVYDGPNGRVTAEGYASVPWVVWIECKAPKGQQSELQKSFQAQVEAHGHKYVIARSLDDVIAALEG